MMVPAGTYVISVPVTDGSASTTTTFTITVNKEDASLEYSGDVFKNATTSTTMAVIMMKFEVLLARAVPWEAACGIGGARGAAWRVGADGAVGTVAIVTVLGVVQAGLAVLLVVMV